MKKLSLEIKNIFMENSYEPSIHTFLKNVNISFDIHNCVSMKSKFHHINKSILTFLKNVNLSFDIHNCVNMKSKFHHINKSPQLNLVHHLLSCNSLVSALISFASDVFSDGHTFHCNIRVKSC